MSCSTIFEMSLEDEITSLIQNSKKDDKPLRNTLDRLLGELKTMKNSIQFYENNYERHKTMIKNLKIENRRLRGELYDFEVPDMDDRPRNPSPFYDTD